MPRRPVVGAFTMRGRPVLTASPDGALVGGATAIAPLEDVVADGGAYLRDRAVATPGRTHTYTFTFDSRADLDAFRTLFDDCAARHAPLWFPLWYRTFELVPPVPNISIFEATYTLRDVNYRNTFFPMGLGYRYFFLTRRDGAYQAIQAHDMAVDVAGTERLKGATDFGHSVDANFYYLSERDGAYLWWLRYGRFDTDTLDIEWLSGDLARVEVTLRELVAETPS